MSQQLTPGQADDLAIRFLAGQLTAAEQAMLEQWIAESAANQAHFAQLRDAWLLSGPAADDRYNASDAWNAVEASLPRRGRLAPWRRLLRVAAILLLPFLAGGGLVWLYLHRSMPGAGNKWISVVSPKGATTQVTLADGTEVWLNAGSKLQYSDAYDLAGREVKLEGEAFFKVRTNPRKPFHVKAAELDIQALGTSFNVKAYPEEKTVVTTLVEGRVKINGEHAGRPISIMMKPREHVTWRKARPAAATAASNRPAPQAAPGAMVVDSGEVHDMALYTGWKDGTWVVASQSLAEIAAVLERRFNVQVVFNGETLQHYKFSGTFRQETLEQVLDILKLTAPLRYTIEHGTVTIIPDKELEEKYSGAMGNSR